MKTVRTVSLPSRSKARWIRAQATGRSKGNDFGSLAEIQFLGKRKQLAKEKPSLEASR